MAIWRRGPVLLCYGLCPVPQNLVLPKVSLMCTACPLLFRPGHFIFQASHLQGSLWLLWAVFWFLPWMWCILTRCILICLWNETCHHLPHNWGPAGLSSWEVWYGICTGLLGEGITTLGYRQVWLEWRNMGLIVGKLGSQCCHCAASHRWLCVYAEGQGSEMVPPGSFIPGWCLCACCLSGTCFEKSKYSSSSHCMPH